MGDNSSEESNIRKLFGDKQAIQEIIAILRLKADDRLEHEEEALMEFVKVGALT